MARRIFMGVLFVGAIHSGCKTQAGQADNIRRWSGKRLRFYRVVRFNPRGGATPTDLPRFYRAAAQPSDKTRALERVVHAFLHFPRVMLSE